MSPVSNRKFLGVAPESSNEEYQGRGRKSGAQRHEQYELDRFLLLAFCNDGNFS
jgi:hypothetical protein